jgi:hypothetical protein
MLYDGQSVTLDPSIGNWSFPCRSHSWLRGDRIVWAAASPDEQAEVGRAVDRPCEAGASELVPQAVQTPEEGRRLIGRLSDWVRHRSSGPGQ